MLTSLELFGFKSFADRTLFEFSPGITCVVGPNGSGKSNVVDAIKWILGDQSPKSLRGKEMSDVIFNGSSGRKPSGFAEATLAFDNQHGLLSLDTREVRIGRRLYQSGDSEYLLNGAAVRLKDLKDLFLGTGAGTAAYSIIEQGRVDQVLQANPTARRVVFEEAAGVSRFKARRIDAERKLEKVSQNLQRLTDIVDEVEARLNATRSQASKAAKFREVSHELRDLWLGLAADDYRHAAGELAELETAEQTRQRELDELTASLAALEAEKSTLDARLSQVDEELRNEERRVATVREQIAAHESTIRHQSSRATELDEELNRLRHDRIALAAQASAVERDLAETAARLTAFEEKVASLSAIVEERHAQCDEIHRSLEALDAETRRREQDRDEQRRVIADDERRATRLHSQIESSTARVHQLQQQIDESLRRLANAQGALQERKAESAAAEAHHAERLALLEAAVARRDLIVKEQAELEQMLHRRRERRSAAVARIHVLEDLERRQEGVSVGVRDILRRAHDSPYPPWNEVLGSVGDLLQVSLENAPLLEVALGGRSQLVVVRRLQPLVDWLNRQAAPISGRVGFLELHAATPSRESDVDLSRFSGVIARADALAEPIPEAAGLARRLLEDTWIVDRLDSALALRGDHPGLRFVTRQGELVERDGTVYAGTVPNSTALVSRRSELRNLKHEILRIDREIEAAVERADALAVESEQVRATVTEQEAESRARLDQLAECRGRIEMQAREAQRIEEQLALQEEEQDAARRHIESLRTDHDAAQASAEEGQRRVAAIDADLAHTQAEVREHTGRLADLREQLRQQQLELATQEERVTSLRDTQTRLQADQTERVARKQQADARLEEVDQACREARLTILRTRGQLDAAFLSVESLSRGATELGTVRRDLRARWSELARDEERLHHGRREQLDARHQADLRLRELRHNLAALEERSQEDYQTGMADVVGQGRSAFRVHVLERYAESSGKHTPHPYASLPIDELYVDAPVRFAEVREELDGQVNRLRRKLKLMGSVNTEALSELDDLESRFTHLSAQLADLQEAKNALEDIIRRINRESRKLFLDTFEAIRGHFRELYRKLFGGGEADIILEDPEDVLECGIDIVARPPGKELRSISLLSGGEKTMTAVALLFAMFRTKPSPYCILDEVDAALDEANVDRYVAVVREFAERTQFVVITHRKRTMTAANVLYGVTMEQAGVSKRMSVRFEDVSDDGHFHTRAAAA
jgi:chromosome segregation protein